MSVISSVCQSLTAGTSISEAGFTQTAGSNRIVFVCISFESSNAPETVTVPTWDGQAMTPVNGAVGGLARGAVGTGFSAWCQWFQILEADLPADAGTKTFACTLSAAPAEGAITVVIVDEAAQTADVVQADNYAVAGAGNPNWSVTAAEAGSVAMGQAVCGNAGTYTPSAGFTEIASEQNLGSSGHQAMQGAFGAGAINATHTFSGTVNRAAAAGFVVGPFVQPTTAYDIQFNGDATPDVTVEGDYNGDASHGEANVWVNPGPDATGPRVAQADATPVPARHSMIAFAVSPVTALIVDEATLVGDFVGVGVSTSGAVVALVEASGDFVGVGVSTDGAVSALLEASGDFVGVGVSTAGSVETLIEASADFVGVGVSTSGLVESIFSIELVGDLVGVGVSTAGAVQARIEAVGDFVGVGVSTAGAVATRIEAQADFVGVGVSTSGAVETLIDADASFVGVGVGTAGAVETLIELTADMVGVGVSTSGNVTTSTDFLASAHFVGVGVGTDGSVFVPVEISADLVGVGVSTSGLVESEFAFEAVGDFVGVGVATSGQVQAIVTAEGDFVGVGVSTSGAVATVIQASGDFVGVGVSTDGAVAAVIQAQAAFVGVGVATDGNVSAGLDTELEGDFVGVGVATSGSVQARIEAAGAFVGVGVSTEGLVTLFFETLPTKTRASTQPHPSTRANTSPNPVTRGCSC